MEEPSMNRRLFVLALLSTVCGTVLAPAASLAQADVLPSWNESPARAKIIDFVARVTREGGPDYVRPAERIAVFDNDGTLWSEQPRYFQLAYILDRVRALAPQHPEWKTRQPFKALLAGATKAALATGEKGLLALIGAVNEGVSVEEFEASVLDWLKTARHPRFNRPYTELVFQPMLELLGYLRANGFKTFIVSGGGIDFMRPWMEQVYGIPPEQVVGSSGAAKFGLGKDGRPTVIKQGKINFIDDGPGKPVGIQRFIGRRPIFAFGNSDGDLQMLQYVAAGSGPRLALYVHHDDAEREYAYDRKSSIGKLDKGLDEAAANGWPVVSMKRDWKTVYPAKS
jgi:phosphoglycolate phosphatase-like HAD superfamily hydrolase